ncbi:MAG: type IX secretion system membrane protein PorP/SprF [Taibaiella sp.]|nr:type IX secretion system membrane protein PorP/SprF [Taibaiella sp.]
MQFAGQSVPETINADKVCAECTCRSGFKHECILYENFSVGASYRTKESVVALFEMNITKRTRFGYAYDIPINKLQPHTRGSHELMVAYDIGETIIKMKSPRFF